MVSILTPLVARVTFPRVKSLERLLSLLNFSREALTRLLTGSLSKAAYDGQSGHCSTSLDAGTVNRGESGALGTGDNVKNYKGELKRHCVQLVYFILFFFTWSDVTGVFVKPHYSLNSVDEDGSFAHSIFLQRPT